MYIFFYSQLSLWRRILELVKHVLRSLEAYDRGEKEEALMHATFSIEGTAKKLNHNRGGGKSYKNCLRSYYWLLERFTGGAINLTETKFSFIKLDDGKGKIISEPDLADIIYHIHRCSHAHSEGVPTHFQLLDANVGESHWSFDRENKGIRMPDKVIFALLGVSVFCKANANINSSGNHYLSWIDESKNEHKFLIKDNWGREYELREFFKDKPLSQIILNFKNWES